MAIQIKHKAMITKTFRTACFYIDARFKMLISNANPCICPPYSGERGGSFAPRGSHNDHRGAARTIWPEPQCCQACSCHQVVQLSGFYFYFSNKDNSFCTGTGISWKCLFAEMKHLSSQPHDDT